MGEMADFIMGEIGDVWSGPRCYKTYDGVMCKKCGKTNLIWGKHKSGKFWLKEKDGQWHKCEKDK